MKYATVADMVSLFGEIELIQLTDPAANVAIDTAKVEARIADAQTVVDSWIGRVYRLPLRGCAEPGATPGDPVTYVVPPQLVRIACDIARFYLYKDVAPDNVIYLRYKAAQAELQAIADGKAGLACPLGCLPGDLVGADAQEGWEVRHSFSPRQITDDSTRGYA